MVIKLKSAIPAALRSLTVGRPPLYPSVLFPRGFAGLLTVNDRDLYGLRPLGRDCTQGFRFYVVKDGSSLDVETQSGRAVCDCSAGEDVACIHILILQELRKRGVI